MGFLFGVVNQILLAVLAVGLLGVIVWGCRMWWQRRPTRTDRALLAAIAVGWALPLLGITLAAFLLIDLTLAVARRRPAGRRPPGKRLRKLARERT